MLRGVLTLDRSAWIAQKRQTLLFTLLMFYITTRSDANPVSIPEINGKSVKNIAVSSSNAALLIKPSPQDAQLNSLNAYATNYGHFAAQFSNNAAQGGNTNVHTDGSTTSNTNTNHFKASFKLPEVENNFTPIQTYNNGNSMPHAAPLTAIAATPNVNSIANNNVPQATPVLMQYLPHVVPETGVQYLQLIPTRPLIVPISPYLNGNAPPAATQNAANAAAHALHPPLAAAINAAPMDYGVRSPPILAAEPINSQQHAAATAALIDMSNAAPPPPPPYGIHTYANALQPYRSSYRINREVKGKNFPSTLSLNMNEYIPGPNETLRPLYMRGRP
ncbi:uncharacterized protein LOC105232114 [Bactrocera dorsalis]|uniref:Uncharacterized protein LOC105232114 n=1 Tax=Bactrocera dorsalis TaxID=27457 RepID=A0A6I9VFQ7_BACDO|nr:uncharacterized protein LOC105232114 [Bactrocera dorsalis]